MSHPNRNPILAAVLAACERERIAAGVRRDGCALAHMTPVLAVLDAMARTCPDLSSARYLRIAAARDEARATKQYAEVHDRHAHGEIDIDRYERDLAHLRAALTTTERDAL